MARMDPRLRLVGLAWLLAAAVPASAAAQWQAPVRVSEPITNVGPPGAGFSAPGGLPLLVGADGRMTVVWGFVSGSAYYEGAIDGIKLAFRSPRRSWSPERTLGVHADSRVLRDSIGVSSVLSDVVSARRSETLAATPFARDDTRRVVRVYAMRNTGVPYWSQRVWRGDVAGRVVLGANTRGEAIAVWAGQYRKRERDRVIVARRDVGERFEHVRSISREGASDPVVAMMGRRIVVAWRRGSRIEARLAWRAGRRWSSVRTVGRVGVTARRLETQLAVAGGSDGRAVVAWFARPAYVEGSTSGPAVYRYAYRAPNAPFSPAVELERYRYGPSEFEAGAGAMRIDAALDSAGHPLIAWQGGAPDYRTRLADAGHVATVSSAGPTSFDDLAVGPDGRAAVSWTEISATDVLRAASGARVAVRSGAGVPFGAPEQLVPEHPTLTYDFSTRLAFTGDGTLHAVWTEDPGKQDGDAVYAADRAG